MTTVINPTWTSSSSPTPDDVVSSGSGLLPSPPGGIAYEGALSSIYELLSRQRSVGLALGQQGVLATKQEQSKALADELAAIQREAQNQSNSGDGFFGSVGQLITDVVTDIAQGNLSGAAGDADRDLSAAWNSPHFWSDLQNGLQEISVIAAAVSQTAQQLGGPVGVAVGAIACTVDQGADIASDLAGARETAFASAAKDAEADALSYKNDLSALGTQNTALIDDAKGDDASLGHALAAIAGALSTNDHSLVDAAAVKG